jgi:hypothetical protein
MTKSPAPPTLAVVGRVNKGKSSVVATLTEDDRVPISPRPGTTVSVTEYPVRVDGTVLFTILDTPGFEDAPRALAWLHERVDSAADRADAVAAFVETFRDTGEFVEECRLLTPIVAGASILYVVDGAQPYRENYEAEMEILRWTGRPGIALINRKARPEVPPDGGGATAGGAPEPSHVDDWRLALDQYFKVVRTFDAHQVTFDERVRLLETFRELREEWRRPLSQAIDALRAERARRLDEAAAVIADALVHALTFTLAVPVKTGASIAEQRHDLEARFHDALRDAERSARRAVERLFAHTRVWREADLPRLALSDDLFAERTWQERGLSTRELVGIYTASGAAAGASIDAAVGGTSLLAGTLIGAGTGLGAGLWAMRQRIIRATSPKNLLGRLRGADGEVRIGPHDHPNFPWVLLDRALLHLDDVASRAHARQDDPVAPASGPEAGDESVAGVDASARRTLNDLFKAVRKQGTGGAAVAPETRAALHRAVRAVIDARQARAAAAP